MTRKSYRAMTIRDLVDFVARNKSTFPKGLDTKITSGDFEGNCHHVKHEFWKDVIDGENAIFFADEKNERVFSEEESEKAFAVR